MKIFYIVLCFLFLVLGMVIYIFVNQETLLFALFPAGWNIPKLTTAIPFFDNWLLCYGADFFWSIAFALAAQFILDLKGKQLWLLCFCSILRIVVEGLQGFQVINGTFDLLDIVTYFMGSILAILIIMGRSIYESKH